MDSLTKPIALNLTKLNLTKPNGNIPAGSSKELSDKQRKRQYAIAMEKEREQEARVKTSKARKSSEPTKASGVDPYAFREGKKR